MQRTASGTPHPSKPLYLPTFTVLFYESEMRTLYAALSHYQALCRHAIAPGTPSWAHDLDFESVRKKLLCMAVSNHSPDDDSP